ncbi:DUF881 domain-containing protein [Raineyella fluvialis]|uniref:DUF881 domain-containing protein n=1 Tax=Raineyella fluvialis TaxID=2662261 RepID=A0A5Q2FD57_9ACTN|nr:DUF881 domain-containing protein [Raineyella fluvialis]QGF24728.1 DUF881 domain-containing protein [Raineyella fluvialis]
MPDEELRRRDEEPRPEDEPAAAETVQPANDDADTPAVESVDVPGDAAAVEGTQSREPGERTPAQPAAEASDVPAAEATRPDDAPAAGHSEPEPVSAPEDDVPAELGSEEPVGEQIGAEDAVVGEVPEVAAEDWSADDDHRSRASDSEEPEPEPEPEQSEPEPVPPAAGPKGSRRTFRDWLRPERSQVVVALVLAVVAFGLVTQVRARSAVDSYSSLRQSDLVGMLDGLNQESQRLQSELESLQTARSQLESGKNNEALARAQAEERLTALGILAGTIPAQGTGITITITDPQGKVKAGMILDALEEMRDAGGEVMQINGRIRVVASTWVASGSSGIVVDGQAVSTPITLDVIGDPHALEEAARFRGGLVSQITDPRVGGQVTITKSDHLTVTSLHSTEAPRFARADPSASAGTGSGG